jgi:hypothetical protein
VYWIIVIGEKVKGQNKNLKEARCRGRLAKENRPTW